jgi:VanZ family protein
MSRKSFLGRAWLWLPPIVYMLLIFYLSSESAPLPEITTRVWDKSLHAIEYGTLALLFCRAFIGERYGRLAAIWMAFVFTSAYAASDEWHQLFVPSRSSDLYDWLADSIGGGAGLAAFAAIDLLVHGRAHDRPTANRAPIESRDIQSLDR